MRKNLVEISHLRAILDYNPATGAFTWKATDHRHKTGDVAGGCASNGFYNIAIDRRMYAGHQLARYYVTGEWPKKPIAPLNGDYSDTRYDNLREESQREKSRRMARLAGESGHRGVCFDNARGLWMAHTKRPDGSHFNIGRFASKDAAIEAYTKAYRDLYGDSVEQKHSFISRARDDARSRSQKSVVWKRVLLESAGVTGWASRETFLNDVWSSWVPYAWLVPVDTGKPIGPDNYRWEEPFSAKFDTTTIEGRRGLARARRKAHPAVFRNQSLKRNFGLTLNDYQVKLNAQGGGCACCGNPEKDKHPHTGEPRFLCVDHCHTTGKVRDLLCGHCNKLIGYANESIDVLEKAIAYLRKHANGNTAAGLNET